MKCETHFERLKMDNDERHQDLAKETAELIKECKFALDVIIKVYGNKDSTLAQSLQKVIDAAENGIE